jgi:putative flippase GtrA
MSVSNDQSPGRALALGTAHRIKRLRYLVGGASGMVVHYFLMFLLLESLGAVIASTVGAVAGIVTIFAIARYAPPRFTIIAMACLGVNAAILSLMILSLPTFPAQLVASGSAFLAGYVLNDLWSFLERSY